MTLIELKAKAAELGLTPDDVRAFGKLSTKDAWEMAIASIPTNNVVITEPDTEPTPEPDLSELELDGDVPTFRDHERIFLHGLPPNPKNFTTLEDFQVEYDKYIEWLWKSDDDIGQAESEFVDAEDIWEQAHENPCLDAELQTEIACLIDHPALCEGELLDLVDGSDYLGKDERGLPTHWALINEDTQKVDIYSLAPDAPDNAIASIDIGEKLLTLAEPSATPLRDELTERISHYVGVTMTDGEFAELQSEPLDEFTAAIYLGWLEAGQGILAGAA